jgi:hypothetical protein
MLFLQDIASIGRLVGIPYFSSERALDEEKADMAELRRVRADGYDPLNVNGDEDTIRDCQVTIALRMQGQFERRILRRTIESRNWEGKPLIDLPACYEHTVLLSLQPSEREIHDVLVEQMRERCVSPPLSMRV